MNYLYHAYASNNPAGIDINLGWYALAECICTKHYSSEVLSRWCGLKADPAKPRKPYSPRAYVAPNKETEARVIEIYRKNPTLKNKEIAAMVNRSNTFVSKLLKSIGVRRNRWDGYVSKDKRYKKKEM